MARIFLSHASPDTPVVRRIAAALRTAGHDLLLNEDYPGEPIPASVERGLLQADFVVICLSKVAAENGWIDVQRDFSWIQQLRHRKERILLARQEAVVLFVPSLVHVNLFPEEGFDEGIAKLTRSIVVREVHHAGSDAGTASARTATDATASAIAVSATTSSGHRTSSPTPAREAPDLRQSSVPETIASSAGTDTAGPVPASRHRQRDPTPPQVDIGILTIRDDEFRAVLRMFPSTAGAAPGAHREYTLRYADAGNDGRYTIAVLRQAEQGLGEAQTVARDLVEDLAPRLVLVIGIAGGLPSDDVTLGDVVLSTRIHDFTIEARKAGHEVTYAATGGPIDKALANAVADLANREGVLGNWTANLPVRPPVAWTRKGQIEGPPEWQRELRAKLEHHHGKGATPRAPVYVAGPIASSDRLVKDPAVLIPWLTTARNLLAVEMESGGVYRAVRERCPMLAIRGISDIVGLKRSDAWTKYACASAAAFTGAFLRTRPIETAAAGSAVESPHARRTTDQTQPRHAPHVASPTGETRMTADDLFTVLSKLLAAQFEAVLFRAGAPVEYLPAAIAPQAERAIAAIRYFEAQGRLNQLAQIVQQVAAGAGPVGTDPR